MLRFVTKNCDFLLKRDFAEFQNDAFYKTMPRNMVFVTDRDFFAFVRAALTKGLVS